MIKIFIQTGWSRDAKGGQLITISHNGIPIEMENGEYISSMSDRRYQMWYLRPIECENNDLIQVDCKVGIRQLGEDENNTFIAVLQVDDTFPEFEFSPSKVGYQHDFPLVKGKVNLLSLQTAKEARLSKIKGSLESND